MYTNQTSTMDFGRVSEAELRAVTGGFWGFAIAYGFAKLNDYLVKKATEPDNDDIPIEPLT